AYDFRNHFGYVCALQELYRRIEAPAFNYPAAMKARRLVNGLLPELHLMVKRSLTTRNI
ncbi:2693_t:CDS:1, partial [Funneliformis caledonium]